MKKTILLLLALTFYFCAVAQKSLNYYQLTADYDASDGCHHSNSITYFWSTHGPDNFNTVYNTLSKYAKPYKIIKASIVINNYRKVTRAEWLLSRLEKFDPCNHDKISSTIRLSSTDWLSLDSANYHFIGTPNYLFIGINTRILQISCPDTAGTYKVTFSKSAVHFINDSTFTFKTLK
ncbi:MAG: hypothetical protein JWQ66_2944 [Mucilaginibacter sp.]|nr:hypothetical protein [Mucilaginibacter sp.]